ncbi:MAG: alanine--tRNA ligase-related protein [Candidatus Aminicenantales bacterium]
MTKRLYFEDAYLREFEGRVRERLVQEGRPAAVLDRTCFYPESGGQPSDRGILGEAEVLHVFEDGDKVVHVLDRELRETEEVRGVVDWDRRFDHMQQHSGQHVLSQCFVEILEGETRSFHLGEQVSTLEIGRRAVSDSDLEKVESRANEVVFEDREIKTYFVETDKIPTVPLRRPPKKEGTIRVVEVDGFDYSACGGTHCRRTGEIGLIKIIRWDRIRNNLRFEFLCGRRARHDYAQKNQALLGISQKLSVHEQDAAAAVDKTIQDARQSRKKLKQLQDALAGFEATEMVEKEAGWLIKKVWTDKTAEEARFLALSIIRLAERVVLFAVRGGERDHFLFICSDKLSLDMRELMPLVMARVPGKGGGGATLVEIVVEKGADLEGILTAAEEFLRAKLADPGRK